VRGKRKISFFALVGASLLVTTVFYPTAFAEGVIPQWIKNTALWYGEGSISETEFLNAIKFLIENDLIELEENMDKTIPVSASATVMIPNGNFDISRSGFYIPLNLEVRTGTTVKWTNDDSVPHTIQSQNEFGEIIGLFNSAPLQTGESFEFTFEESGVYNYFCSLHPWRVGIITVR
jgi:plastocyanin